MLELKDISVYFHRKRIFDRISFRLTAGDMLIITGYSGCGKSTLLFILALLMSPSNGELYINSSNIIDLKNKEIANLRKHQISLLPSSSLLLPSLTIKKNLEFATLFNKSKETDILLRQLLTKSKMGNLISRYPHQLSAGQRQRFSLIMAICKNPYILLLDEPTSALDRENSILFMDLLREVNANRIIILSTHNNYLRENYGNSHLDLANGIIIPPTTKDTNIKQLEKKKSSAFFPFFFLNSFKSFYRELKLISILFIAFFLSFFSFYLALSINSSLNRFYQNDLSLIKNIITINKQFESIEEFERVNKQLQEDGFSLRVSLNFLFEKVFPEDITPIGITDQRLKDTNSILATPKFLKINKKLSGEELLIGERLTYYSNEYYNFPLPNKLSIASQVQERNLYKTPYFFFSYTHYATLLRDYHFLFNPKDNLLINTWEIETEKSEQAINKLESLNIPNQSPYFAAKEANISFATSLSTLLKIIAVVSAAGIIIALFLTVAIIKEKRNQDLTKILALGGNRENLISFLTAEVMAYLLLILPFLFLTTFIAIIIVNGFILQGLSLKALLQFDILQISNYLLYYLLATVAFIFFFTWRKGYLDIKGEAQ